jgi:hypothetical protein
LIKEPDQGQSYGHKSIVDSGNHLSDQLGMGCTLVPELLVRNALSYALNAVLNLGLIALERKSQFR